MKKNIIFIVIVAIVAILAMVVIWWQSQRSVSPPISAPKPSSDIKRPSVSDQDTTTAIQNELGTVDLNGLDSEFSDIDRDLQSL